MVDLEIQLPDGFLDEEVRCGYTVTRKMKEVWAVELDMAQKLLGICKKHDIKIMTFAGTTLGAVRHKGFIPWDDDMDFIISRADYCKLCEVAPKEFCAPYFFQTEYTDPGTIRRHAQIRRTDTTAILDCGEIYLGFNQGIFIDIFPFDSIPNDPIEFEKMKRKAKKYCDVYTGIAQWSTRYNPRDHRKGVEGAAADVVHNVIKALNGNNRLEERFYRKYETTMAAYDRSVTEKLGTLTFMPDGERFCFTTGSVKDTITMPFEFLEFPVPIGYEEQLRNAYGDYHKYVMGGSVHGKTLFDTERPYTQYLKNKRK